MKLFLNTYNIFEDLYYVQNQFNKNNLLFRRYFETLELLIKLDYK